MSNKQEEIIVLKEEIRELKETPSPNTHAVMEKVWKLRELQRQLKESK